MEIDGKEYPITTIFNTKNKNYNNNILQINLKNINNINNMSYMFCGCSSLKILNLSIFNTNNVYNMSNMFYRCSDEFMKKIKEQYKNLYIFNNILY